MFPESIVMSFLSSGFRELFYIHNIALICLKITDSMLHNA